MPRASSGRNAACPREDDVVIAYTGGHWEFGMGSAPASLISRTCDSALALMRPFARNYGVDVWVTRDGRASFELAVQCRPETMAPTGSAQG